MLGLFLLLAFAITWIILIPAVSTVSEDRLTLAVIPAAFGPFLAAVITLRYLRGPDALKAWLRLVFCTRIHPWLYLAGALLLPLGIGVLHIVLYSALGGETDFSDASPWYLYPLFLIPTALLTGGNEEPGWRGFALPALLERFHPIPATLALGVIHAIWHLPLMGVYQTTIWWFLFNVVPLTFMLNWLYLRSRWNIIPVMLLHAGTNVIGSFFPTPVDVLGGLGTNMFIRGCVYWGIAILLIVATRGRLGYR